MNAFLREKINKYALKASALSLSAIMLTGCNTGSCVSANQVSQNLISQNSISICSAMDAIERVNTELAGTQTVQAANADYQYIESAMSPSTNYYIDYVAPSVSLNKVYIPTGNTCEIEAFINYINDDTPVTYTYVSEPDFSLFGEQPVNLTFVDSNGNVTDASTTLTILPVTDELVMELTVSHNAPLAKDFLLEGNYNISYTTALPAPEDLTIGTMEIELTVEGINTTSKLTFVDTVAPEATAVDIKAGFGAEFTADQFVSDIIDATLVTIEFAQEPDWSVDGERTIDIVLTDEAGNETHLYPVLNLIIDTAPPLIQANAVNVIVGNSLSYSSCITVTDNLDRASDITVSIDASAVDLKTIGTYEVYITATDLSGNTSEKTLTVNVIAQPVVVTVVINQDSANAKALEIMSTILTDGMTTEQQVYAIWRWARYNIGYTHDFTIDNYASGAYRAMVNHRSNCFGYASTIKTMCDLLGIPNFVVCDAQRPHYWNVIDTGSGYYHWDATPRIDGTIIWKWDDATLLNYSNTHGGTHKFDRSQYPYIN